MIEVISPNYEAKDLDDLPPVYLANDVLDVLVADVDQRRVTHFQRDSTIVYAAPIRLNLQCGCTCAMR